MLVSLHFTGAPGVLAQQKFILIVLKSSSWPGMLPLKAWGGSFLASSGPPAGLWWLLGPPAYGCTTPISVAFSPPCGSVSCLSLPFLGRTAIRSGPTSRFHPHLAISAKTLFPKKATFIGARGRTSTSLFGGHNSTCNTIYLYLISRATIDKARAFFSPNSCQPMFLCPRDFENARVDMAPVLHDEETEAQGGTVTPSQPLRSHSKLVAEVRLGPGSSGSGATSVLSCAGPCCYRDLIPTSGPKRFLL